MLTTKSFQGLLRVAAQKKVDGLPNEDAFVVSKLKYQRKELLGLKEAYGNNNAFVQEVGELTKDIALIDDAFTAYPELAVA